MAYVVRPREELKFPPLFDGKVEFRVFVVLDEFVESLHSHVICSLEPYVRSLFENPSRWFIYPARLGTICAEEACGKQLLAEFSRIRCFYLVVGLLPSLVNYFSITDVPDYNY